MMTGLINDHLYGWDPDHPDKTTYCPECCGPCGALRDYFCTSRGQAEADSYILACPAVKSYEWQLPDRRINWDFIAELMTRGYCINH